MITEFELDLNDLGRVLSHVTAVVEGDADAPVIQIKKVVALFANENGVFSVEVDVTRMLTRPAQVDIEEHIRKRYARALECAKPKQDWDVA